MRLTKRSVEALPAIGPNGEREYMVTDDRLRGFCVRVKAKGEGATKSFLYNYRLRPTGETRRIALGIFGSVSVEAARARAQRMSVEVQAGGDPSGDRRRTREEQTLAELGAQYLDDVKLSVKESTWREYSRLWKKHVVPALGSRKVGRVAATDVRKLHRTMSATPYLANRVVALLSAFFAYAEEEGARPPHSNPASSVKGYAEIGRERFLSAPEVMKLGEVLSLAERVGLPPGPEHTRPLATKQPAKRPKDADTPRPANPVAVAALRALLLTGCREGEILSLRWDAVDLERGFLRLGDTKTGKSVRPLGAAAVELLDALPRLHGSPFVFPGAKRGQHLKDLARLWYAVRHAAGLQGVRLHDLRHSFASVSASGGDSLLITRSLLGHRDVSTTQRYAHLADDPVRAAADRTAGALAAWLRGAETPVEKLKISK